MIVAELQYRRGTSDKLYFIHVERIGVYQYAPHRYQVRVEYGRRGHHLNSLVKDVGLTSTEAGRLARRIEQDKRQEGYETYRAVCCHCRCNG